MQSVHNILPLLFSALYALSILNTLKFFGGLVSVIIFLSTNDVLLLGNMTTVGQRKGRFWLSTCYKDGDRPLHFLSTDIRLQKTDNLHKFWFLLLTHPKNWEWVNMLCVSENIGWLFGMNYAVVISSTVTQLSKQIAIFFKYYLFFYSVKPLNIQMIILALSKSPNFRILFVIFPVFVNL